MIIKMTFLGSRLTGSARLRLRPDLATSTWASATTPTRKRFTRSTSTSRPSATTQTGRFARSETSERRSSRWTTARRRSRCSRASWRSRRRWPITLARRTHLQIWVNFVVVLLQMLRTIYTCAVAVEGFLMAQSRPLFSFIFIFSVQLTVNKCSI